ncbi:hypothetical protein IQ235_16370 [Oscillatoriales cyanobacterium LEGE 11467]|uniref:Uncharacterized protein n=1 Tax=Zarconia navalis LEGE 11467 TaxID=1828826 RepID=A0A928VXZ5_9CYAN|nr:hypothetical protein [Zarconia navalis]MBE9042349.1 hypothetical protein [Zarconia navalis LEGE 11467]
MPLSLGSLLDRLKNWFPRTGAEIEAKASKLEAQLTQTNKHFQPLSREKRQSLREKIETLPSPESHRAAVKSALEAALARWKVDRDTTNSVVILASPIEPLDRIWEDTLETWEGKTDYQVRVLQPDSRPQDCTQIADQLREQLAATDESDDGRPEILVIPHLEWYFLRTVEGLDGIECLQQLMVENSHRFWAIGCNSWAWQYLDYVCQSSAYCDRTLCLPELEPIEIKDWLASINDGIEFCDNSSSDLDDPEDWDVLQENWQSRAELVYFDKLQKTASGLGRVAIQLWLASLCVKTGSSDDSDEESTDTVSEEASPQARRERIDLPDRPALTLADRHLVYSVGSVYLIWH